jgi:hypothetical protein
MCKYCKDFNNEKEKIQISQITIKGLYYNYDCPIKFCPNCGIELRQNDYIQINKILGNNDSIKITKQYIK